VPGLVATLRTCRLVTDKRQTTTDNHPWPSPSHCGDRGSLFGGMRVGNYPKPKAEYSQLCAGIAPWDTTPPPNDTRNRLCSQRLRVYLAGTALWSFSPILRSMHWPWVLFASSPFCHGGRMLTGGIGSKGNAGNVSDGGNTGS
jgi:hypothetical protein